MQEIAISEKMIASRAQIGLELAVMENLLVSA